nr:hypothetical protein BaRGS_028126 [Batillaria attramentaria]
MCPYIIYDCIIPCVDPEDSPDQCCPRCPNGKNSARLPQLKTEVPYVLRKTGKHMIVLRSSGVPPRSWVESTEGSKAGAIFITHDDGDEDDDCVEADLDTRYLTYPNTAYVPGNQEDDDIATLVGGMVF